MRIKRVAFLGIIFTTAAATTGLTGTLDDAPFRVVVPGANWKLDESVMRSKGDGVYLVGVLTNSQTGVWLRVAKTEFAESTAKALNDVCTGVRDSFLSSPSVKPLADEEAVFLGYKARRFSFQNAHVSRPPTYEEAIIFAVGKTAWTVNAIGLLNQTNQVRQSFTLFQKRGTSNESQLTFQELSLNTSFYLLSDTNRMYQWVKVSATSATNTMNGKQATIGGAIPVKRQ